jgi:3',5'-cyclic AMP phosphodiesterase CpdA
MFPLVEKIKCIIHPVLGFPAVVVAGESLTSIVSLDDGGKTQDWVVRISTHDKVSQTYTLTDVNCDYDILSGSYAVTGIIPPSVPREVFDLTVSSECSELSDMQPNAVRVIKECKDDYRFVHLTDLHIGDPRGYLTPSREENNHANPLSIVGKVLEEISFVDPEFVLFSGDLVFGGPYDLEYLWAWETLSHFHLPIFMVPGNHDGYASGVGLLRDGLGYWSQVMGSPYYSFNYGDRNHFVCVNTYDGTVSQRNGFYFVVQKWGGTLGREQMEWLGKDLELASQQGRVSVVVCHHDPRGDIHRLGGESNPADKDNDGYAEATELLDMLFHQEWNDKESGEEMVRIIRQGGVSHIFLGHIHSDFIDWDEESGAWWVHTTSAGSSTMSRDDFWGYRIVEVANNRIARVNQTAPEEEEIPPGDNDPSNNQKWDYQSYPSNNILITTEGSNDGTSTKVVQEVTNRLETSVSGVLKFYMPWVKEDDNGQNNYGYQISGGTIRQIARSGTDGDGSELIFYIETGVDPNKTRKVTMEYSQ